MENIQSIAYEEISSLEGANKFWTPSQQDLLPITIFVNHSESQIVITYNIQQPICRFVACFLSGLYRKLARILFNIIIKVRVEIGSDQYKFILENRVAGASLVQIEGHVSRYKQSLLMKQHQQLPLSVQTFARVFPFHFMCDQNLRFIQYGNGKADTWLNLAQKYNECVICFQVFARFLESRTKCKRTSPMCSALSSPMLAFSLNQFATELILPSYFAFEITFSMKTFVVLNWKVK